MFESNNPRACIHTRKTQASCLSSRCVAGPSVNRAIRKPRFTVNHKHLQRCVAGFFERYNARPTDTVAMMGSLASGMAGKRLRYADLVAGAPCRPGKNASEPLGRTKCVRRGCRGLGNRSRELPSVGAKNERDGRAIPSHLVPAEAGSGHGTGPRRM